MIFQVEQDRWVVCEKKNLVIHKYIMQHLLHNVIKRDTVSQGIKKYARNI